METLYKLTVCWHGRGDDPNAQPTPRKIRYTASPKTISVFKGYVTSLNNRWKKRNNSHVPYSLKVEVAEVAWTDHDISRETEKLRSAYRTLLGKGVDVNKILLDEIVDDLLPESSGQ